MSENPDGINPNPKPTEEEVSKAEDIVKQMLFETDSNICVCDCIGCKAVACSHCELEVASKGKAGRGDLCFQNNITTTVKWLAEALAAQRQAWEKARSARVEGLKKVRPHVMSHDDHLDLLEAEILNRIEQEKKALEERVTELTQSNFKLKGDIEDLYVGRREVREELARLKEEIKCWETDSGLTKALRENEEIARLTSALARAHEVLEEVREGLIRPQISGGKETHVAESCGKDENLTSVIKALSDPTGQAAHERWKRMWEVVTYANTVRNDILIPETDDQVEMSCQCKAWVDGLLERLQTLEALEAKGGVSE